MTAEQAYAARVAVDAVVASSAKEVEGGVLVRTPDLPAIWDLNQVLLAPGADIALIERTLELLHSEFAGYPVQRLTVFDPADPVPALRGWEVARSLLMVAGDVATGWPDGVERVSPADLRETRRVTWSEDEGEAVEQVLEMQDRCGAFPGAVTVAARSGDVWAAWASVSNGSIDDVWVQPEFRRRGLGRAVSQAALAAGGWFLWTEAADPVPQALYRSLGMREIGTVVQLTHRAV